MTVNGKKSKEMLIGSVVKNPPVPVSLNDMTVDQVSTFKLLAVHIWNDLKWTNHIHAVSAKIASRLYFLRLLKRAGAIYSDLLSFYCPIAEYASPVWHSSLTVAQSDVLESLQKRAMNIIFPGDNYIGALTIAGIDTIRSRRETLTRRLFTRQCAGREILSLLSAPTEARWDKKAHLMLAYPRDAKTMKKIPPFRSYNNFQSSRKSGVYSN